MSFADARPGPTGPRLPPSIRRAILLSVICVLATIGLAGPALAHTSLIASDPADGAVLTAAPATVTLTFDEPLAAFEPLLTVTGPDGVSYQSGSPTVDGPRLSSPVSTLPVAGTYTVAYRVVSEDGHPVDGTLSFQLSAQAVAPAPAPAATSSAAVSPPATSPAASSTPADPTTPSSSSLGPAPSTPPTTSTDTVAPAGNASTGWTAWQWVLVVLFVALAFLASLVIRRRMEASARVRSHQRD